MSHRRAGRSLHPHGRAPVPADTARVARAAVPNGQPSLTVREALGTSCQDEACAAVFPAWGPPGVPPWRLAVVTSRQLRAHLADRQAAQAVRARLAWQSLLRLALPEPGCDFSGLPACRARRRAGRAAALRLATLLARCRAVGLLTARGQQRPDATHGRAAVRGLHRLALVAAPLRAARTALATVAPDGLPAVSPLAWDARDRRRLEAARRPQATATRETYAPTVGADGCL
jgi:transposase